jgi:hypothetical protein
MTIQGVKRFNCEDGNLVHPQAGAWEGVKTKTGEEKE